MAGLVHPSPNESWARRSKIGISPCMSQASQSQTLATLAFLQPLKVEHCHHRLFTWVAYLLTSLASYLSLTTFYKKKLTKMIMKLNNSTRTRPSKLLDKSQHFVSVRFLCILLSRRFCNVLIELGQPDFLGLLVWTRSASIFRTIFCVALLHTGFDRAML